MARIGHQYQVFRADWKDADEITEDDAAIERLYTLFNVTPASAAEKHDGKERFFIDENLPVNEQFERLYEYLVPIADEPKTLQGEVIRIAGAVHDEVSSNGGVNWNSSFARRLETLVEYLTSGNSLNHTDMFLVEKLVRKVIECRGYGCWDETEKLCGYAVKWVQQNPEPQGTLLSSFSSEGRRPTPDSPSSPEQTGKHPLTSAEE